jgi:hypothetical protein
MTISTITDFLFLLKFVEIVEISVNLLILTMII